MNARILMLYFSQMLLRNKAFALQLHCMLSVDALFTGSWRLQMTVFSGLALIYEVSRSSPGLFWAKRLLQLNKETLNKLDSHGSWGEVTGFLMVLRDRWNKVEGSAHCDPPLCG